MKKHGMQVIRFALIVMGISGLLAQTSSAQTSAALSLYGAFSGTTTGNGVQQSPANSAGGLFELRHIANPIMGFEGTYSYNRANQSYVSTTNCGLPCGPITTNTVKANAHEITADWVPSLGVANFRPFGVLGLGVLLNEPVSSQTNSKSSTKAVYVYGAGLDWGVLPHLGLRFQYRGNLYSSPNLSSLYGSTKTFTHTAEPMIGVYFSL